MTDAMTRPRAATAAGSRRPLWLVLAAFLAPLALAFLLYYGVNGWRPSGTTARGDLVDPPRPLPESSLATPDGAITSTRFLRGHWSLVYIGAGSCDARCRKALSRMRQVRLALGDDRTRVQRVFLATGDCCDRSYLESEHPGLLTARLDDAPGARMLAAFTLTERHVEQSGRVYIVDPLGNLMMSYPPDAPPKGMLEDLKKLLRLSHIG
jgi:cytochrome oxidase Cu insertion factor (SCO1/SenC/PrrC family)